MYYLLPLLMLRVNKPISRLYKKERATLKNTDDGRLILILTQRLSFHFEFSLLEEFEICMKNDKTDTGCTVLQVMLIT